MPYQEINDWFLGLNSWFIGLISWFLGFHSWWPLQDKASLGYLRAGQSIYMLGQPAQSPGRSTPARGSRRRRRAPCR
eukprot:2345373-Heterocapsa_arctica.AAC.1